MSNYFTEIEKIQQIRKTNLENALNEKGLRLRVDSKLCSCYVKGETSLEWDVERVVQECCIMHWLYNFTDFQERYDMASQIESKMNYFHTHRDFISYMNRFVRPAVKEMIIREHNGYPEVWPWLLEKNNEKIGKEDVSPDDTTTPTKLNIEVTSTT